MSAIQWTDETWNPTTGCDQVSPGCDNCYALTMAKRLKGMGSAKYQTDGDPRTSGPGFGLAVHPDSLVLPLEWKKPRRIFVNSMSDLFHAKVPREAIDEVFGVMAVAHKLHGHEFQVLTKRPERARFYLNHGGRLLRGGYFGSTRQSIANAAHRWAIDRVNAGALSDSIDEGNRWPLPGVWLGTSIESAEYVRRADELRAAPAAVRFISAEPLLGPLPSLDLHGIDWLIIGGESGKGARPLELSWVHDLIARARESGTAVFVKQLGTVWARDTSWAGIRTSTFDAKGGDPDYWPSDLRVREYPGGGA